MKDVYELLRELKNLDARIYTLDKKIKIDIKAGALTNEISEGIKYYRNEILTIIGETSKKSEIVQIEKVARQSSYPISDAQRRLWVLSQLGEGSVAYNIPGHIYLNQDIEIEWLKKAIESTIEKHEILRTVFKEDESGEIRQWILKKEDLRFKIEYKDFRRQKNKEEQIQCYINEDSYKPFDLEKGPLLRATLLQTGDDNYVFYYNMHHIISDGRSMEVLSKDVFSYYNAYKENKEVDPIAIGLKELRIQYKDYSAWQLSQLKEESFQAQRKYWLESLSGELPLLDLPASKQRPRLKSNKGQSLSTCIDSNITNRLKKYSREKGGSLFMGLLAAWKVLMYRYTGQTDIIIGTPVAGRGHTDLEDQIGFYANTLALRTEIDPEENFNKFFSRVKQNTLTAYTHQMYPFDRLVEDLALARDTSRSVVFDVMLVLQENEEGAKGVDSIAIGLRKEDPSALGLNRIMDLGYSPSKFDISITFHEIDNYLLLKVVYNSDVYEQEMVESLIKHYNQLLHALLENPEEKISQINYLSQEEIHEQLFTFNDTEVIYPKDKTIVQLFEEQVAKTPTNIALVFEDQELTYNELNEKSNQFAHYLHKHYQIQPDDLVGIKQERSEWMIVSILGVLKSGGAYVPIDPEYPQDRIAYIEIDTKCKVCIDERELKKFKKGLKNYSKEKINSLTKSNNLAYVIYTSGSTGRPKGVMIEHLSAVNFIKCQQTTFRINEKENILQLSSISFDASVEQIFTALTNGSCLSLIPKEIILNLDKLENFISKNKITHVHAVPSILKMLRIKKYVHLKRVVSGGEACPKELAEGWSRYHNFYNKYGPTETTITSIELLYNKSNKTRSTVSIGQPIFNTQVYILNEERQLQPIGVIGEICIGGAGLARGYLNQEALTQKKFINHPFKTGERLYKTGDLGRWLSDGNIEFIGRKDDQVKIRGYRIELGEIEHALLKNKQIEAAVVVTKENQNKEKELIAYLVSKAEQTTNGLRAYLKKFLPEYMVPTYYVQLDSLPLTSNGKIDRKSLPDPEGSGLTSGVEYVAPRNDIEEKLVKIWEEVLQQEHIGVKDDFFALGGHSLKAVRLNNEYQKELGVKISLKDLFTYTSIETHVELIQSSKRSDFIQIEKVADQVSYPISDGQRRLWVLNQFGEASAAYNMPASIDLPQDINIDCFQRAVYSTIDRHEILRTVFKVNETGEIRQWIVEKEYLGFKIDYKDLRKEKKKEQLVQLYIGEDSYKPFDLEKGPLLRASLLQLEDKEYVFYFNMHHIISDGWSMEVLSKDIFSYYKANKDNKEVELKPLRIQYKDYSAWQLAQLEEESFRAHRAYWLNSLRGELPLLDLPTAKQRPNLKTGNGHGLSTYIDSITISRLKKYSKVNGGSFYMGLLATWNILMYRYTSQTDIIIGTPIAGREHVDLEDQIGFYINTLALRNQINPEESFDELFSRVKQTTLSAYSHQMYPFDRLVEELNLVRDTSRSVVFDMMLVLQNNGEKSELPKLKKKELNQVKDLGYKASKFDMEIAFQEIGGYLSLRVVYNPDVYEQDMVEGLINDYRHLLHAILENSKEKISQIEYLSQKEKHKLLFTFNDTVVAYPKDKTIVDLFDEQVSKTPNNIAVIFEEKELSYKELDECSNQLAHYLQKNYKIKPDDLVGIKLERSEWMIISVLGILKSGGAYVPIDPLYPQDRMDYIEKDTSYKVCINEKELINFKENQDRYSTKKVSSSLKSDHLVYVIYTSGSTGNPKGVLLEHSGVVNRLLWMGRDLKIDEGDVFLQKTPTTFDVSVWELFLPLVSGSKLVVLKPEGHKDPVYIEHVIKDYKVSVIHFVPSMLSGMLESIQWNTFESLRHVVCSGEALTKKLEGMFKEKSIAKLHNYYGPTEASVDVTAIDLSQFPTMDNEVSIGKPVDNTCIYIVNEKYVLQRVGVIGEILIGGVQIARGYLNKPELTAEKFIANPFKEGERLYKTGDLGKWTKEGTIDFIGRKDNQVKIRGYRIELGEIEHALLKNKQVKEAVVLAKENVNKEKELIAYITAKEEQHANDLRSYLKELLPEYMLPAYYVQLEALPLTSNGKIDRKSLPDPHDLGLGSGVEYVAPRNDIEEKMVEIWSEILYIDKEKVGIKDVFFELGGDSIKTIRLISGLRKKMNYELSVTDIYKNDSIEKIVTHISENRKEIDIKNKEREALEKNINSEMDALKERILLSEKISDKENIEDIYPMSDIEKGMVFAGLMNEGTGTYHDQMVYQSNFFEFNLERLKKALMLLTQKHSILRTGFNLSDYECEVQIVYKNLKVGLYYEDISDLTKQSQEVAIAEYLKLERDRGFVITNTPLWSMSVFALGRDKHLFIMQFHHAIIDGWSLASFMTELNNLYVKLGEDINYRPMLLKSNYKDFIVHNKINLADDSIKDFWKREMAGYERLDIFIDQEELANYSYSHDNDYLKRVEKAAKGLNTTVKVVSLAAYLYMLKVLNYNPEIVIGLVTNIRPGIEDGDKILGCFLNSIPLRVQIDGSKLCADFISSIHNKLIELKNNESLSTLEIATICQDKSEHANPFFDVFFNYIDFHVYQDLVGYVSTEADQTFRSNLNYERTNTFLDFTVNTTSSVYKVVLNTTKKLRSGLSLERLSDLYFKILEFILKDIDKPLKDINYLNEKEKQKIIKYSGPEAVFKIKNTVLEKFSEQVAKTPNQIAVIFEDRKLTYNDLDIQSDEVSYYLRKKITTKGKFIVGMILDRSEQLAVITLGILKSGSAYVAIDNSLPAERKKYILKDSGCKIIITEAQYASEIEKYWNGNVIIVDSIPSANDVLPKLKSDPEDSAFVIYTSGSTGVPKGILQTHKCLLNVVMRQVGYGGFERNLNVLQYSSISFDVFIAHELFFSLLSGGCLHIISESLRRDLNALGKYIVEKEIGWLLLPVSALNTIVEVSDELWQENIKLKHIVSAGEQLNLSKKLISYLVTHPAIRLHNFYGPSETHNASNYTLLDTDDIGIEQPIGRPSVNTWIHILSEDKQLVPIGIPGELYISGSGLAKGYINLPDMTSERFIPNPYLNNELMYKTGDIGKWLPNGIIKFLGRKDDQVKIRGYRVELGEIENALLKHPKVKQCAVIAPMDKFGRELIGYIVSQEDLQASELRTFLLKSLPDYMVPVHYMNLEKLPLNTSGKIDRKSLPDTKGIGLSSGVEYIAPRNETEKRLVKIWEKVLQRENIGVKDDFFALGGHSLKAVRLGNEYQKELAVKISLKDLFTNTSLESQAELIRSSKRSEFIEIEKVSDQLSYAISNAQRRLWVLSQYEGGTVAYNISGNIYLNQDIDIECFKKAIDSTIERHEILRTVFKEDVTGEVKQWILGREDLGFKIDYKDFRKAQNKEEQIQSYIREDSYKGFDLTKGPLLRAALLQVEETEYIFYFNMHHIISDGWSMEVLRKDVFSYYEAYKEKKEPVLKELRIQYKDYAGWQLAQLREESFKAHRTYWLNSLSGELPLLNLPGKRQRPRIKTHNGHGLSAYIGPETTHKLRSYSQENGGSLFMGLLAVWNILMYRYTGQKDIIVGTSIAGREHVDLEGQIGFYVNTLALRNEINPKENFKELFSRIKQTTLRAYSHQTYPFDKLVEELNIQGNANQSTVFDVMLVLQNNGEKTEAPELKNEDFNKVIDLGYSPSTFDIRIGIEEIGDYLNVQVVYNLDVYDREMMEWLIRHYKQLVSALLASPEEKISQIDYLSQEEKHKLLVTFNDTRIDYPKDKTLVELFEEQAGKTPNNIAVVFEKTELSYKHLDELSNKLASYLREVYQISPDDLVGIQLDRNEWMIVVILGILKAGGAYVPIDPEYPSSKKEHIMKDTSLKLLITEVKFIHNIDYYGGKVFAIDVEFNPEKYSSKRLSHTIRSNNLAYVIYTSGSTGKSKGVMVEHRAVVNTLLSQMEFLQINSKTKGLQFASFSFDASIWETFLILLSGARLSIINAHDRNDFALVTEFINAHEIDIATLPPSYLNKMDISELKGLVKLITAGESAVYEKAMEYLEFGTYYNAYGPTETSICCTIFKLENKNSLLFNSIPIGKPISNTQIYLLSEEEQLQPVGVIGEICIGGAGLARGYLNQEELTREKFIANPFKEGECLYKTGDLARWLSDGNIEFIGRIDDQVKIRGYRIELGEIEHALQSHKEIEEAVVLVKENQNHEKELVAYITAKTEQNTNEIRSHLKGILPEYMLPAYYVQLEELPLTSNGKIDKKSLPDPEGLGLTSGIAYVAPRNEIEEKLIMIWQEVLQRENIGIKDDFFALGGHSLKLIKMINQINKQFGLNYDLKGAYSEPTIESMSQKIKTDIWFKEYKVENENNYNEAKI
jgi:tyrocidine synthetase-3